MKTSWINTRDHYHAVINTPDISDKERLYHEKFIQPWQQMMQMVSGMMNGDQSNYDPLAGARAWGWVLPEHLDRVPDALQKLEDADAWRIGAEAMQKAAAEFAPYADLLPFDDFEGWLVVSQGADVTGWGHSGGIDFMNPRFIVQYSDPTPENIPSLPGAVVHEMNHIVRLRVFPWDMVHTSVADYIIHEGVAESFAKHLFGEDVLGYYVTDFTDEQISTAKSLIGAALDKTGFEVIRGYIFGDHWIEKAGGQALGMPAYGGYAIGYRVVQAYLERTGKTATEATFIPAQEIVAQSGYFD